MISEILREATQAGANELMKYFDKTFTVSRKEGINNLVTSADVASEKAIIATIQKHFPEHQILTEETGKIETLSEYKWIVDPIDGTVNFAHGLPFCCVSIAIEKNGELIFGSVFNPVMKEWFWAEKNQGAFLNDKKISVSQNSDVASSFLVTGFPYIYINDENGPLEVFERFIRRAVPVRRLGSAALDLSYVACGRFDGFFEHKLEPWDSAAGVVLVAEAGGKITDFAGNKFSVYQHNTLATNGFIHEDVLSIIKGEMWGGK